MQDADVLWHVLKPVTSQVIANAPGLSFFQKTGVGVDTIDLKAVEELRRMLIPIRLGFAFIDDPALQPCFDSRLKPKLLVQTDRRAIRPCP